MILICPSCQTRYFTSEAALGPSGRTVRCAACDHSWFAKPPETLDPNAPVEDESGLTRAQVERLRQKATENAKTGSGPHAELREKHAKKRQQLRYLAAAGAWIFCGFVFVGAGTAAISMRQDVVEAWPKTASIYAMMGMDVNRFGLEFGDIETRRSFDGTTPVLTISGTAVNVSNHHRPSPVVKLALQNENGNDLHAEYVNLLDSVIAPGQTSTFTAHIVAPPMDSFDLKANFESPKDVPIETTASIGHHSRDDSYSEHAGHDTGNHQSDNSHGDHATSQPDHGSIADDNH